MFTALLGAVAQGILWGAMVLGVYITYKLLDIAQTEVLLLADVYVRS